VARGSCGTKALLLAVRPATPQMTSTTDFCLSIRVSIFEYVRLVAKFPGKGDDREWWSQPKGVQAEELPGVCHGGQPG